VAYRCVGEGTKQEVQAFPAYCAVAFAGIGDLPDTIMSRTIVVPMRRRRRDEKVEPFRARLHEPIGHKLRVRLSSWVDSKVEGLSTAWPDMPEGVTDRAADVWEPLLAIADAAGGDWPEKARAACVSFVTASSEGDTESLGVRLLTDLVHVFRHGNELVAARSTKDILAKLHAMDEAPWSDLRGKELDARGLGNRLRKYGVKSKAVRIGEEVVKGYARGDLWDPWLRYVHDFSSPGEKSVTAVTTDTSQVNSSHMDTDMDSGIATDGLQTEPMDQPIFDAVTSNVTAVTDVTPFPQGQENDAIGCTNMTHSPRHRLDGTFDHCPDCEQETQK
jgi:hypothetical protein